MERARREGKKLVAAQPSGEWVMYSLSGVASLISSFFSPLENAVGNLVRRGKGSDISL